jgi:uncharacterized protein DUF4242
MRRSARPIGRMAAATPFVIHSGWNALSGDYCFPILLLRDPSLEHNIDLMSQGALLRQRGQEETYCVYDGPDPEAIRRAADRNGLPVESITRVQVLDPYFYK